MKTPLKHKSRTITKNALVYKNFLQKTKGLMFSKPKFLIFPFKKSEKINIHTLFVFFPIDLVFLDKNRKVIEVKQNMSPFSFYFPYKEARYLIEMPYKTIKRHKIRMGSKLSFKNNKI